jgi:single-strand DNA-binding protein
MAWDINSVMIIGRLASDVELKTIPGGAKVANFRVAVGGAKNADGKENVSFFTVVAWNKTAENCEKYLLKGKQLAVLGRLEQRSWTTQDGGKRSTVEIVAERIEFLGGGNNTEKQPQKEEPGQSWDEIGYSDTPL